MTIIRDIFSAIVAKLTKAKYPLVAVTPAFDFGYWPEIATNLVMMGYDKALDGKKYPLVVVNSDFSEVRDEANQVDSEINITLYIIAESKMEYTTHQRIDTIYIPTLYPLYEALIDEMKASYSFDRRGKFPLGSIPHTKKDLFYMGSLGKNQNQLSDIVDAIQVDFKGLKLRKQC